MYLVIFIKTLSQVKKEKSRQVNPEEIDFGYCIPDCGNCCPKTDVWINWIIARGIANKLDVSEEKILSVFKAKPKKDERCPFVFSYNLCMIHNLDERPLGCNVYECPKYSAIKQISAEGYNLPKKLKELWLNQLNGDYNRENWLMLAVYTINNAHDLIFNDKTSSDSIEEKLQEKISLFEAFLKQES